MAGEGRLTSMAILLSTAWRSLVRHLRSSSAAAKAHYCSFGDRRELSPSTVLLVPDKCDRSFGADSNSIPRVSVIFVLLVYHGLLALWVLNSFVTNDLRDHHTAVTSSSFIESSNPTSSSARQQAVGLLSSSFSRESTLSAGKSQLTSISASDLKQSHRRSSTGATHKMCGEMMMYFHTGYSETILFESWKIDSVGGLLWSMLVIFIMATGYEGLKYFRDYLFRYNSAQMVQSSTSVETNKGLVTRGTSPAPWRRMVSPLHLIQTVLHMVQFILSYWLMLIFMTYNVWLCLSVALGAGFGYFIFGSKQSAVDMSDHCG